MRSTSDLTTRRLSLRLRLSGRCSSKLEIPTASGMNELSPPPQAGRAATGRSLPPGGGGGDPPRSLQDRRHLFLEVGFDDVARLHVLEPLDPDAAVEAAPHLGDVVLEPPQRRDPPLVDDP